jgi:hypothetical protein
MRLALSDWRLLLSWFYEFDYDGMAVLILE